MAKMGVVAEGIGNMLASKSIEADSTDLAQLFPKGVSLGTRTGYKWEIELIPGVVYGPADFYESPVMTTKDVKFADLPETFQKDIKKAFDEYLAHYKKGG